MAVKVKDHLLDQVARCLDDMLVKKGSQPLQRLFEERHIRKAVCASFFARHYLIRKK